MHSYTYVHSGTCHRLKLPMHLELRFYLFHLLEMSATVSNEHFIGIRFALMVDAQMVDDFNQRHAAGHTINEFVRETTTQE